MLIYLYNYIFKVRCASYAISRDPHTLTPYTLYLLPGTSDIDALYSMPASSTKRLAPCAMRCQPCALHLFLTPGH